MSVPTLSANFHASDLMRTLRPIGLYRGDRFGDPTARLAPHSRPGPDPGRGDGTSGGHAPRHPHDMAHSAALRFHHGVAARRRRADSTRFRTRQGPIASPAEDQANLAAANAQVHVASAEAEAEAKAEHLEAALGGVADGISVVTAASRVVARVVEAGAGDALNGLVGVVHRHRRTATLAEADHVQRLGRLAALRLVGDRDLAIAGRAQFGGAVDVAVGVAADPRSGGPNPAPAEGRSRR